MSHLHDLVKAARASADANDMAQVKRYLDRMQAFADEQDKAEESRREAVEQGQKRQQETKAAADDDEHRKTAKK